MKVLIGAFSWFFIGIAYMIAVTGGYTQLLGSRIAVQLPTIAFFQAGLGGTVLGTKHTQTTSAEIDPADETDLDSALEVGDARPRLVAKFLERYNSPMQPYDEYGVFFVELADTYGVDFRLLPAISMQESGLCKSIPEGTYNCLGLGIHARGTWGFESYKANFEAAAKILKKNYIDIGLTTPEQIMKKYTPSSNGSWANSVNQWMAEMRYNDRSLGRELKTNASVLEFAQSSPTPEATMSAESN